jgi:hypothetical protein
MLDDLQGCRDSFKNHFGDIQTDRELAEKIFSGSPLEQGSIFHYLDWIRYSELNDRLKENKGIIYEIPRDLFTKTVNDLKGKATHYPFNLFIKWAAVMDFRSGAKNRAVELLELLEKKSGDNSIFYSMVPAVSRMMINSINGRNLYDECVIKLIDDLTKRYPASQGSRR